MDDLKKVLLKVGELMIYVTLFGVFFTLAFSLLINEHWFAGGFNVVAAYVWHINIQNTIEELRKL